jgi:hypothetical protein
MSSQPPTNTRKKSNCTSIKSKNNPRRDLMAAVVVIETGREHVISLGDESSDHSGLSLVAGDFALCRLWTQQKNRLNPV